MMNTITEVIQVSFQLVQVILRASARTSRKNWIGEMRFLRRGSAAGAARRVGRVRGRSGASGTAPDPWPSAAF